MSKDYLDDISYVVGQISDERIRQIEEENYQPAGDDECKSGELARAAASYAISAASRVHEDRHRAREVFFRALQCWPWHLRTWKPTNARDDLIKAGALIVAEIERLDRAEDAARVSSVDV